MKFVDDDDALFWEKHIR